MNRDWLLKVAEAAEALDAARKSDPSSVVRRRAAATVRLRGRDASARTVVDQAIATLGDPEASETERLVATEVLADAIATIGG